MKKIKILLLTPLLSMLCSCDAFVKTIHVTGQVIDATTCKPIKNAHLVIAKFSATGSGYSVEKGNEVYTDATGIYQLEIDNASGSDIRIVAQADGYFESGNEEYRIPIDKNVYKYTIHMTPKALVNFVINRTDTTYSDLDLFISNTYGSHKLAIRKNWNTRDSALILMNGNQANKLTTILNKYVAGNSVAEPVKIISVYAVANDTITYQINY